MVASPLSENDIGSHLIINNDTQLAELAAENSLPGDGTIVNPYVFDGLSLQVNDTTSAIQIVNTTLYVTIRNIVIQDLRNGTDVSCIFITNSTNINLEAISALRVNDKSDEVSSLAISESSSITVQGCYLDSTEICESDNIRFVNNSMSINEGLYMGECSSVLIEGNKITSVRKFEFLGTDNISLVGNSLNSVAYGITMCRCTNISQWSNEFINCSLVLVPSGFYFNPLDDLYSTLEIADNNTVNGKPLLFLSDMDLNGAQVSPNAGQIILFNVHNGSVQGQNLSRVSNSLSLVGCSNILIRGNNMNWTYLGLMINNCSGISIFCNDYTHCHSAAYIGNCASITFEANQLNGDYYFWHNTPGRSFVGIAVNGTDCIIKNNNITLFFYGMVINGISEGTTLIQNTVFNCTHGLWTSLAEEACICDNIIQACDAGFYIYNSMNLDFRNNSILNGYYAIYMRNADRCEIANNVLFNSTSYAIYLCTESDDNLLYGNNISENNGAGSGYATAHVQACDVGQRNQWNRTDGGNIWSDWLGPDVNLDGIVDSPYPIGGTAHSYDYLPLTFYAVADDDNPPQLEINSPANHTCSNSQFLLATWTSMDLETSVVKHYIDLDGEGWQDVGLVTESEIETVDGTHTFSVKAVDMAGNEAVRNVTFMVDLTPPVLTIGTLEAYYTDGGVSINWTVSDAGIGLDRVELRWDGGDWYDVTGLNTYMLPSLGNGCHLVEIMAYDAMGWNRTTSALVCMDLMVDQLEILAPQEGYTNQGDVEVRWEAHDDMTAIVSVEMMVDGGGWFDVYDGNHLVEGLEEGIHSISVRAWDEAGHNITRTVNFIVDTAAPLVQILTPAQGSLLAGDIVFSWTVFEENGYVCKWRSDSGVWSAIEGTHTSVAGLSDGAHSLTVSCHDLAGNYANSSVSFTIDSVAPVLTYISLRQDELINTTTVQVSWAFSDATSVSSSWSLDGGHWHSGVTKIALLESLSEGEHVFVLSMVDQTGHWTNASRAFTVDVTAPILSIYGPEDGSLHNSSSVVFEWLATDLNGVDCQWRLDGGDWTYDKDGQVLIGNLSDGWHIFEVIGFDGALNSAAENVTVLIDAQPPSAQCTVLGDVRIDAWNISIDLDETIDPNNITLVVNSISVDATLSGGYLNVTMNEALQGDSLTVHLICKDAAGNVGDLNWTFMFDPLNYTVQGSVTDSDGQPLQGVHVLLDNEEVCVTDQLGRFSFSAQPGSHKVLLVINGYANSTIHLNLIDETSGDLGSLSMSPSETDGKDASFGTGITIAIATVAIIVVAVAALVFLRSRKG